METKQKTIRFMAVLLVFFGLIALAITAGAGNLEPSAPPASTMKTLDEVEPRIPIQSLSGSANAMYVVNQPGSYYLTDDVNVVATDKNGINVEVDDVTIDLMGYTLRGPDSGTKQAISMTSCSNVEIRNGSVRDFYRGIAENSINGKEHRVINVRAISNLGLGIYLYGKGHLVKDCTAGENGSGIDVSAGCAVTGSIAYDNDNIGIDVFNGCTVMGNTARANGSHGIFTGNGCTVTGNTAYSNIDDGIFVGENCTVTSNTACFNAGDGIQVSTSCQVIDNTCRANGFQEGDGAGIHAINPRNRIERNHVTYNDRGIDVDDSNNLIVKNSASGNTTEYDIVANNKVGTISTDPTTAGPWANFDF